MTKTIEFDFSDFLDRLSGCDSAPACVFVHVFVRVFIRVLMHLLVRVLVRVLVFACVSGYMTARV